MANRIDEAPLTEMEKNLFARFERFAARNEMLISIVATAWFWLTVAVYARWIELPEIPFLTDKQAFWISMGTNIVWWSYIRPRIAKLKAHSAEEKEALTDGRP